MSNEPITSQERAIENVGLSSVGIEEFRVSAERFRTFFQELEWFFVEREEILCQIALALLGREHVLMTGPPGNAKSQISNAVLRRILDEQTGKPSLFTRQFTENTVQTDLVGPIDFKTLMETGRTEHFTDEGMLGAVHAFLDEVFDGRDMLLRSTLNVLQERELKQGSRTTKGAIECALMTSNRYLAEILEEARETLLAFVDRIAFISFVPKGFADPANLSLVLQRQLGERSSRLEAPLLIQDLDVLQEMTDSVFISDGICSSLGTLIELLERELNAAMRADPNFVPTRYFSTRTAVRAGRVLKAICVYDKIFRNPDRPLEVTFDDLYGLRLHLLLGGQPVDRVAKLLARETDPRERRQLDILRTEREIFERCMARLPRGVALPRPRLDLEHLAQVRAQAIAAGDPGQLVAAAQQLAAAAGGNAAGAPEARRLLQETVNALTQKALSAGLASSASREETSIASVEQLSSLADRLEQAAGTTRPLARWLRGRALLLLGESAALAPLAGPASLAELPWLRQNEGAGASPVPGSHRPPGLLIQEIVKRSEALLSRLETFNRLRNHILAEGADLSDPAVDASWGRACGRLEDELVVLWDEAFRLAVIEALGRVSGDNFNGLLAALTPAFVFLEQFGERLGNLGADRDSLKRRVVGPRIRPLMEAAFRRLDGRDHKALLKGIETLLSQLAEVGIQKVISPGDIVAWTAEALVRGEKGRTPVAVEKLNQAGYWKVRMAESPTLLVQTLLDVALKASPALVQDTRQPGEVTASLTALIQALPEEIGDQIAEADLARVERSIRYLEQWWGSLRGKDEKVSPQQAIVLLEKVVNSGFLRVLRDEEAGVRLASEARFTAEVFSRFGEKAQKLRERLEHLELESSQYLIHLLQQRSDAAWAGVFSSGSKPS